MPISQRIPHLLHGISQRPSFFRSMSQAKDLVNGWLDAKRGLMKRPPAEFKGEADSTPTGWDTAFVFPVNRDADERHRIVIANDTLRVYEALTGAELTVHDNSGGSYLTGGTEFRAVSAGDTTYILNRDKTVGKGTSRSAAKVNEALVVVRQSDFSTRYAIGIGFGSGFNSTPQFWVEIKTDDETQAQAHGGLNTNIIAKALKDEIEDHEQLSNSVTVTRFGSTLHITPTSSVPMRISTEDGLADKGMDVIKGKVQSVEDLPRKAPNGTILEVEREPGEDQDNFYVVFDDDAMPEDEGAWIETLGPGMLKDFDNATMPHRLVRKGNQFPQEAVMDELQTGMAPDQDLFVVGLDQEYGWDKLEDDTAISADADELITDHDKGVKITPSGDFTGGEHRIEVNYDIDTSLLKWGETVRAGVYVDDGAETLIGYKDYDAGNNLTRDTQVHYATLADGDSVLLKMTYSTKVTPTEDDRKAVLNAPRLLTSNEQADPIEYELIGPPVKVSKDLRRDLTFDTTFTYRANLDITLTIEEPINSIPEESFTYTTSEGDTGTEVAAGLQTLVDASANYGATNPSSGVLRVDAVGSDRAPNVEYAAAFDPLIFVDSDLSMVTNEFAGKTIKNLTDGSSGTVDSNTATTVTVSSLTGGALNQFSPGDVCTIDESGTYFTFEEVPWAERAAGDDTTNPFPEFVDRGIDDLFIYRNRLGFLAGPHAHFSRNGDFVDLWRATVVLTADDDRIAITASSQFITNFDSAVLWNNRLFLVAENVQFEIAQVEIFTPRTARLDDVSHYFITTKVRPLSTGRSLFFASTQQDFVQVFELPPPDADAPEVPRARDITIEIPSLIPGEALSWDADPNLGLLALVPDGDQSTVYVYSWTEAQSRQDDDTLLQEGWSKWEFPSGWTIAAVSFLNQKLGLVVQRSDGAFFEEIDLGGVQVTPGTDEQGLYLDARVEDDTSGVTVALNGSDTDVTVPYDINTDQTTDGELVVYDRDSATLYSGAEVTRPAANQVKVLGQDLTGGTNLYIGVLYEFRYTFGPIRRVGRDGQQETNDNLRLVTMDFFYHDTTEFKVEVTPQGRTKRTKSLAQQSPADGKLTVYPRTRGDTVTIEIVQDTAGGVRIGSVQWEGNRHQRSRRV